MPRITGLPWPASQLTDEDLHALWCARESAPSRTTITKLLAEAVRKAYGRCAAEPIEFNCTGNERIAA